MLDAPDHCYSAEARRTVRHSRVPETESTACSLFVVGDRVLVKKSIHGGIMVIETYALCDGSKSIHLFGRGRIEEVENVFVELESVHIRVQARRGTKARREVRKGFRVPSVGRVPFVRP